MTMMYNQIMNFIINMKINKILIQILNNNYKQDSLLNSYILLKNNKMINNIEQQKYHRLIEKIMNKYKE